MRRLASVLVLFITTSASIACQKEKQASETLEWENELMLAADRPLSDVAGDPDKAIWAVGNGVYRRDKSVWREISFSGRPRVLSAVVTYGDEMWAVGPTGAAVHFDGKIWAVERVGGEGSIEPLVDVAAWPTEVWAIAAKEIFRRRNTKWESWKTPALENQRLGSIYAPTDKRAFLAVDPGGIATYDGNAWQLATLPEKCVIRAIHGISADDVWAVGEREGVTKTGIVLHFDGKAWTKSEVPSDAALASVYARSVKEVWASGERGTLIKWDGNVWRTVEGLQAGASTVHQVYAPSNGPLLVNVEKRRIAHAR
jgi:hypothetical protein